MLDRASAGAARDASFGSRRGLCAPSLALWLAACASDAAEPAPTGWDASAQGTDGARALDADVMPPSSAAADASGARFKCGDSLSETRANEDIAPLFAPSTERSLPITFVRTDGVLVTRGAGRVRQRHELEGTYGPFGPHYFEHRTFGFVIEDFTPTGQSRVRVTYLPVARPTDGTNFRAFKIYGNGNVFHQNMGMSSDGPLPSLALAGTDLARDYARSVAPFARVQTQEVAREPRANRPLMRGDLLEFEFGVFIDPAAVRPGSRTSYYSDSFRYRVGDGGLTVENRDPSGTLGPSSLAQQGGATTTSWLYAEPETYFEQMAANIQHEHVQPFVEGRRLFHTSFESGLHSEGGNPPFAEQANKLGPLFVAERCSTCHPGNGGGRPLTAELDDKSSLTFKLYEADTLGNQLKLGEGSAAAKDVEERSLTLDDGEIVVLRRTRYEVSVPGRTGVRFSARVARRLVGMGLLEALDEETLLARADPQDCDRNGISGRASTIAEPSGGAQRLGRFGWKAEKTSVEHQVADALAADLGVETRLFPGPGERTELADGELSALTTYMRLLAVPPQRDVETREPGRQLFVSVGCASCHAPVLTTGTRHPFVELRAQTVRAYTDLLLHDMGAELADASGEPGDSHDGAPASASEWRTPPLWGVGLARTVQGYVALLHDGRAASVLEAVLWHGGEASSAQRRFRALSREDRKALLEFVESL